MIRVTHEIVCDECGARSEESYLFTGGSLAKIPCIPTGWTEVGLRLICGAHRITIEPAEAPRVHEIHHRDGV